MSYSPEAHSLLKKKLNMCIYNILPRNILINTNGEIRDYAVRDHMRKK